jgi:5-methylcytosine-specific restriction endonuclease McrBC regulatory subunit McrC
MDTIILREGEQTFVSSEKLSHHDAATLAERIPNGSVEPSEQEKVSGWEVTVHDAAGIFALSAHVQVIIQPKFGQASLMELLAYTRDLPISRPAPGATRVEPISIVNRWVELFIEAVSYILAVGLHKEYVIRKKPSFWIRGRLDVGMTMRRPAFLPPICEHQELTVDNDHNQILYAALQLVADSPVLPDGLRGEAVRLVQAFRRSVTFIPASEALRRVPTYSDMNLHYEAAHGMAMLILSGAAPSIRDGSSIGPSFLFSTNRLFEEAVYRYLDAHLPSEWIVKWGHKCSFADNPRIVEMTTDILVCRASDGQAVMVLDCKNKRRFYHQDAYQVVAYAKALDITLSGLVYPTTLVVSPDGGFGRDRPILLRHLVFDLNDTVASAGRTFLRQLLAFLELVRSAR